MAEHCMSWMDLLAQAQGRPGATPPAGGLTPATLADRLGMGLVLLAPDLSLAAIEPYAASLIGRDRAVPGVPVATWASAFDPDFEIWLSGIAGTREPDRRVVTAELADGRVGFVNVQAEPVGTPQAPRLLLAILDLTEAYETLLAGAQQEKMAAIGLLAAGIAHEFNNIWASVHGYAELARQNSKFAESLATVAIEQSERAAELIHALLSFSDRRLGLRQGVALVPILQSIQRLVGMEMQAKRVRLELSVAGDPHVTGHQGMLQQIVLNLVLNAYQAVRHDGSVHVSLAEEGGSALLRVSDSGAGMTAVQRRRLFEPFFTTKGALGGNDQLPGRGLGLTLTYNFVRMHGGTVEVESERGHGTSFTVRLPLAAKPAQSDAAGRAGAGQAGDVPAGLRVLVIDDEPSLHGIMTAALDEQQVVCVGTAAHALARLQSQAFDVVFLDLVLQEGMHGFELFDRIREAHPHLPIILLTGRSVDAELEAYAERANGLVRKPFALGSIHSALHAALHAPCRCARS